MKVDDRTKLILEDSKMRILTESTVVLYGVGGVGSYVFEALVRMGVGHIHIVDKDVVDESNINRQLIATMKTVGVKKIDACKERAKEIREDVVITSSDTFVLSDNVEESMSVNGVVLTPSFVVDAIDNITGKLGIIEYCNLRKIPIISCMGTGNKLFPELFEIDDIYNTSVCPLCKVMRKKLKEKDIKNLTVLYSRETPIKTKNSIPGSTSFTPGVAGLIIAGYVVRSLIGR